MQTVTKKILNTEEQEFVNKFRQLDDRGKASVKSLLDYQYTETQKARRHGLSLVICKGGT